MFQFGVQVDRPTGDTECFAPLHEAFFLERDLMTAATYGDGGGRVTDKSTVDLNIGAGRAGVYVQRSWRDC